MKPEYKQTMVCSGVEGVGMEMGELERWRKPESGKGSGQALLTSAHDSSSLGTWVAGSRGRDWQVRGVLTCSQLDDLLAGVPSPGGSSQGAETTGAPPASEVPIKILTDAAQNII